MNQSQIRQHFQQQYNRGAWGKLLSQIFPGAQIWSRPERLNDIDTNSALEAFKLGQITLNENGIDRTISVFEVQLAPGIVLERNRVGLRNLLKKYWRYIDGAFVSYYQPGHPNWRFTYVSELTGWDDEGEQYKIQTEPKRYTYILGETETCRTAAERFAILSEKGSAAGLNDLMDAFSVEKLSKAFFDEYKTHYQFFCNYMLSKPGIRTTIFTNDDKAIRDFAKKMLGRIVFLYFIQKKGWLGVPVNKSWGEGDSEFLTNLFNNAPFKSLFYSNYLTKLFFDTLNTPRNNDIIEILPGHLCRIPYLNGGLFEEENPLFRHINFPTDLFFGLFNFFGQYNFTIYEDDPTDQIVAVDPEMLGHIFENLLEDNKDKGAFYTPKEIVHYMCQESLTEYLSTWFEQKGYIVTGYREFAEQDELQLFPPNLGRIGQQVLEITPELPDKKIDRELIENLLKKRLSISDKSIIVKHALEINKALDSVKICDPAIGSGAFPMGLLHEIYSTKQFLYEFEHGHLNGFNASAVKLNIIQNSIYGVDIEKGAVDIARLRFWLSLIVDEPVPKPLPNLDYKIVVGDSLIGKLKIGDTSEIVDIDWGLDVSKHGVFGRDLMDQKKNLLNTLISKQKIYFSPESDKKKLAIEIRELKINLLINQLELMVKVNGTEAKPMGTGKSFIRQTELYLQTLGWKKLITQLQKTKCIVSEPLNFFDWKLDFPEVMNEDISFKAGFDIVIGNPPYVFSRENLSREDKDIYNKRFTLTQFKINLYILFIEKGYTLLNDKGTFFYITPNNWLTLDTNSDLREFILNETYNIKILQNYANVFENASVDTVIIGFNKSGKPRVDYLEWENKTPKLITQKDKNEFLAKKKFVISKVDTVSENSLMEKVVGIELQKMCDVKNGVQAYTVGEGTPMCTEEMKNDRVYHSNKKIGNNWIKYLDGVDVARYSMGWSGQYIKYGRNLSRPRQFELFCGERILVRQIPNKLPYCINASFIDELTINDNNSMIIKPIDPKFKIKYILAILNSRLISKWFALYFGKLSRKIFPQFKINELRIFPIADATLNSQEQFENYVTMIHACKSEGKDTNTYEQHLDNLVYKLYNLTYDEVKVVDPDFPLSEAEYVAIKIE